MSPRPGLKSAVSVQAWGRQLGAGSTTDPRLETSLEGHPDGTQTPERGATCSSGTATTGAEPAA